MKRNEVYTNYQQSAGVKTLATILHHQDSISDDVLHTAVEMMLDITKQAMREAGCEINELGQEKFEDAVYFDFTMPISQKITLLKMSDGELSAKTEEMIKELSLCQ